MKGMEVNFSDIQELRKDVKHYNDLTRLIVKFKNREQSVGRDPKNEPMIAEFEKQKDKISRIIMKKLSLWDLWELWLKNVPGVGPWIGAELIIKFFYKLIPVCQKCGHELIKEDKEENGNGNGQGRKTYFCTECQKSAKGEGNLEFKLGYHHWKSISAWIKYLGRAPDSATGKVPKMQKGTKISWSPQGRNVAYQLQDQFVKKSQDHPYRQIYDQKKAKKERTHPDTSKLHRHRMAMLEMIQVFLAHFMVVAHEIEGWEMPKPYVIEKMGHTGYVPPFYWDGLS